jgi:hypothetical protein
MLCQTECPETLSIFYWTPDMPEIVREQAHLLLSHLAYHTKDRELFHPVDLRTNKMHTPTYPELMMRREIIKKNNISHMGPGYFSKWQTNGPNAFSGNTLLVLQYVSISPIHRKLAIVDEFSIFIDFQKFFKN